MLNKEITAKVWDYKIMELHYRMEYLVLKNISNRYELTLEEQDELNAINTIMDTNNTFAIINHIAGFATPFSSRKDLLTNPYINRELIIEAQRQQIILYEKFMRQLPDNQDIVPLLFI